MTTEHENNIRERLKELRKIKTYLNDPEALKKYVEERYERLSILLKYKKDKR